MAHLAQDVPPDMGTLWMSITGAVATPFIPVQIGVEDVPPEYKQHRYMGKGSDSQFLDPDFAPLEGTRSAFRVHKRVLAHTCENPETFLKPVTAELEAFEEDLIQNDPVAQEEQQDNGLDNDGDRHALRERLTQNAEERFLEALALGEDLARQVEERTREEFGIRMPEGEEIEGATWRPESQEMNLEAGFGEEEEAEMHHRCYLPGFEDYPREHGSYEEERFLERGGER